MSEEPWNHVYRYRLSKHVDGRPPSRKDIDPIIDIPRLVRNLAILEVTPDGYRYALAGSEIVGRVGQELTGQLFGVSGFLPPAIEECRRAFNIATVTRKPNSGCRSGRRRSSAKALIIALPLVASDGTVEKILGAAFYNEYFAPGSSIADVLTKEIDLHG